MKRFFILLLIMGITSRLLAQGQLSGDLMINANFYDKDTSIGATSTQYLHEMSSAESWMFINYQISGFSFSVRYDLFNNSALLNPQESYTKQGLAFYQVSKTIEKLDITAGTFYDQFGTGIIFRSFEDRLIGLDYAIKGVRLKYNFSESFMVKAFTGLQKYRFDQHPQVLKGINLEKNFSIKDRLKLIPGVAFVNRTLDKSTIDLLANKINSYPLENRFVPKYNMYAFSLYNTLNYKGLSFYVEYAYKTRETIKNKQADSFINKDGDVIYSNLNYSRKGIGISLQYKKSNAFAMRTSPYESFNEGVINYMPPMSKQTARTLPARYNIAAQEFGEQAFEAEITASPNKKNTFTANYSYIEDNAGRKIYAEIYGDYYRKFSPKIKMTIGAQSKYYDKKVYEKDLLYYKDGTREDSVVKTLTPFFEISFKMTSNTSLRAEFQYMYTEQDHGDFIFGLLELNIAPHFSFSVSDMVNNKPLKLAEVKHYYNVSAVYTLNQTRFSIGYMKQVEGVVCTGGVCRIEPAFSGLKFNLTTSF
jgi:hypothetical protein